MTAPRLTQVTAVSADRYRAVFTGEQGEVTVDLVVDDQAGVPVVSPEPDLFTDGTLGDPRPVIAAVTAMHRARRAAAEDAVVDPLVSRAVQTAQQDAAGLRLLIDWPLSAAGDVLRNVAQIPEQDRSWVFESGLHELESAASDPRLVAEVLPQLAARFGGAREIRRADLAARRAALDAWAVPEPPAGLTAQQASRVAVLRDRAATLDVVYLLLGDAEELPVAPVPGTDLLVVRLPD
ncbi:MAG: hypothetical protein J2P15_22180 [Micromonosporaceae bacterium]|nr:hypothetical protein [Micromonosporaceae bacterium]